ncbi:MAG: glycosyltransferase family 4 protein [Bacteroidales bacterium]|nr:glycosyltransferase family 4 protein [Bacteroidales bacterium]
MKRICHITTVHPRYDVRIFHKECRSLAAAYEVHLIVADGRGDETVEGVHIHDIGKPAGRRERMFRFAKRAYRTAIETDATIYHFHDSELLPTGKKLARKGHIVIYDSHEDLPRQILTKPWIPKALRKIVSALAEQIENHHVKKMTAVVAATPHIQSRFQKVTSKTVACVCNYPILDEITANGDWNSKTDAVCYVGGIFKERGIREMIQAVDLSGTTLKLAGKFSPDSLQAEIQKEKGWERVDYRGFIGRKEINQLLAESMAGLLLLHPLPSYVDSLPIKLFEYMAAGIPVICSDFPLWRDIVEGAHCGICVNPFDTDATARAIRQIADQPSLAAEMGANGRKAAVEKYSWDSQAEILIHLYQILLNH